MITSSSQGEIAQLVDQLETNTTGERVSLGDLMQAIEHRSHGPLLLLPALIAMSPVGGVPGMSIVTGGLIILIAAQILFGRQTPWVPGFMRELSFEREKLTNASRQIKQWTAWLDKLVHKRWEWLAEPPYIYGVAVLCLGLAALFYPLALVPFGVFVPAAATAILALGVTARDGLMIALGTLFAVVTFAATIAAWPS